MTPRKPRGKRAKGVRREFILPPDLDTQMRELARDDEPIGEFVRVAVAERCRRLRSRRARAAAEEQRRIDALIGDDRQVRLFDEGGA